MRSDLEIIIVDNNSSTQIVDFNNFPGKERSDVTLIRDNKSLGGGGARNTGLIQARGKWIIFIDSDDFFNYSIRTLLDKYVDSDNDVIWFKVCSVDSDTYENRNVGEVINKSIDLLLKGNKKGENNLRYGIFNPWGKMIRREFIEQHNIRFEDSIVMNDVKFAYSIGHKAKKITVEKIALMCNADRANSVSKNLSQDAYLERIRIKTEAEMYYKKNGLCMSCLRYHNYSLLVKFFLKYPKDIFKGFAIMKKCGLSNVEIIMGILFKTPLVLLNKLSYL